MEPGVLIIRKGVLSDLSPLIGLLKDLFSIEQDFVFDEGKQRHGLEWMLDKSAVGRCLLVAEEKGEVIGMCSGQILISSAEGGPVVLLEDMVVRRDRRRRGIGRQLLATIEAWAENMGATRIQLLADKNNRPALRFYKKNNWQTTQLICLRKRYSI